jgi:2-isopropylmalate synthase
VFVSRRRIQVFDTTLRDGEQSPGIALQPHEKAEIAAQLERLGVDVVEAGFPAASPGDFEGVRAVAAALTRATAAAFARARREDVEAAAEALGAARRSRLHVVIATSALHMEKKLGLTPEEVIERARDTVAHAATLFDEVEFCCEDATRSDPAFVAKVCRAAIRAGATTVNLPDTVGCTLPADYAKFVAGLRRRLPKVTLSVHCHNDLGLAVANTLAGVQAGAGQVECTVNGIGERAGNAALEEVVMALTLHRAQFGVETGIDTTELTRASRLVSELTGYDVQRNKAVVGANAFAHEAGIHQDGLLKDSATYQIMDPAELGVEMTLPLGKHSGRHAFARACAAAGFTLERDELADAFAAFKSLADSGRSVTVGDVLAAVSVR